MTTCTLVETQLPRKSVVKTLGITSRRMDEYIEILVELVPKEFKYCPQQRVFTARQVEALVAMRQWFKHGLIEPQVRQEIIKKGLPR